MRLGVNETTNRFSRPPKKRKPGKDLSFHPTKKKLTFKQKKKKRRVANRARAINRKRAK